MYVSSRCLPNLGSDTTCCISDIKECRSTIFQKLLACYPCYSTRRSHFSPSASSTSSGTSIEESQFTSRYSAPWYLYSTLVQPSFRVLLLDHLSRRLFQIYWGTYGEAHG